MSMFKVSFLVPHEVFGMLQASAGRAGLALPVFVRDTVFKACQIDASALEAMPETHGPKLTRTKRDLLQLLQKHRLACPHDPYLTTMQVSAPLQQSDQSIYMGLRALVRDGLVDRGSNVIRSGNPGAPLKTFAISDLGQACLTDDLTRVERAHNEFQARSQAAYDALTPQQPKPKGNDQTYAPQAHAMLRYIAMAQLGRSIESEADVETMKATHAALVQACDADVAAGAHTYAQILEKVTAKVEALGGVQAISDRFN